jgi:hypothetical protein
MTGLSTPDRNENMWHKTFCFPQHVTDFDSKFSNGFTCVSVISYILRCCATSSNEIGLKKYGNRILAIQSVCFNLQVWLLHVAYGLDLKERHSKGIKFRAKLKQRK